MRTEFRRNSSAARDAQARAAQACAGNASAHKGRAARSALSLLNTHELTPFEDLPVAKQADSLARGTVRLRRSPITGGTASRRLSSSGSLRGVTKGARRHAYFHRPHFAEARTNHRFRCSIAAIVLTGRAAASDGGTYQAASGTTAWTIALNSVNYGNGSLSIAARATDAAGNATPTALPWWNHQRWYRASGPARAARRTKR
jgi:hypothetical protein